MLECLHRAGVVEVYADCRAALNLTPFALESDKAKQQLDKMLFPDENSHRLRTLVLEPSCWNETQKYGLQNEFYSRFA